MMLRKASPPDTHDVADTQTSKKDLLCDLLIKDKKISNEELRHAFDLHKENDVGLGILLVRIGLISDRDMAALQHRLFDLPVIDNEDFPEFPIQDNPLSVKFMKEACIVPIDRQADIFIIAIADPTDEFNLKAIELACDQPLQIKIATISQIERVLDRYYSDGQTKLGDIVEGIEDDQAVTSSDSVRQLKDSASEAPIIRLASLLINQAIELRASDIHIEPFNNKIKVRYRIDGVLQETEAPPARYVNAIISRIKIMAKMDIAEHRLPQDGRIQLRTQGKVIDLRVSTVPTMHGESLVMRILDKQNIVLDFHALGFEKTIIDKIKKVLRLPHGIILVTGPTGSGKTTTLYTVLQQLNTPDRKILTVEDPVEYQLEGINQIQAKPKIGLNFPNALRSIVRQDPDIIMIGEMRDPETAGIAVQSALTGHLVLSTLHTNDAGSSITRLLDMGMEDYLLTSTLNSILSQRLVRTLCPACKKAYVPLPELINELHLDAFVQHDEITLYETVGCQQCLEFGYIGRSVVVEFLILSEAIRRLILSRSDAIKLQKMAIDEGMDTMQINGFKKALLGVTTIDEVLRVTQEA